MADVALLDAGQLDQVALDQVAADTAAGDALRADSTQTNSAATDSLVADSGEPDASSADAGIAFDAAVNAEAGWCADDGDCDDGQDCTEDRCELGVCVHASAAVCPWPAEDAADAVNLTGVEGPLINDFHSNLSAAVWNPISRRLWVGRNSGPSKIWALVEDGQGGFVIDERDQLRAEWDDFGDLEGLTQVDFADEFTVYTVRENGGGIEAYDLSTYGQAVQLGQWEAQAQLGGSGAEGIAFVPDSFLAAQGFVAPDGSPRLSGRGMGGLMFVANQGGGHIDVLDLVPASADYDYVGRYQTGGAESAGLELDRSTGQLFTWHDSDIDQLEVTWLSSSDSGQGRRFDSIVSFEGPPTTLLMGSNFEGIAVLPIDDCAGG